MIDASTIINIPDVEYSYTVNNGQTIHETSSNNGTFCLPPQLKESLISVVANKQGYNSGSVSGKFVGAPFHRVIPNFMIQGGDFTRRDGNIQNFFILI